MDWIKKKKKKSFKHNWTKPLSWTDLFIWYEDQKIISVDVLHNKVELDFVSVRSQLQSSCHTCTHTCMCTCTHARTHAHTLTHLLEKTGKLYCWMGKSGQDCDIQADCLLISWHGGFDHLQSLAGSGHSVCLWGRISKCCLCCKPMKGIRFPFLPALIDLGPFFVPITITSEFSLRHPPFGSLSF